MKSFIVALPLVLLACTPAQDAKIVAAEAKAAALVNKGALFCAKAQGMDGALVVMLANAAGVPVTVIDQSKTAVATGCAIINAIPVAPPANPAAAPLVATNTTLPPVAS